MQIRPIPNRELAPFPGGIIAEFASAEDAKAFRRAKGPQYVITGGINLSWAVRPLVVPEPAR